MKPSHLLAILAALVILSGVSPSHAQAPMRAGWGELTIKVIDRDGGQPLPSRIHLKNEKGVAVQPPGLPFWKDHFVCEGSVTLELRRGNYTFTIEAGPEYVHRSGHFRIEDFARDEKIVDLKRALDMAAQNWWSGDLGIARPQGEIELLMRAEDLHVAPLVTWTAKKSEWKEGKLPSRTVVRFDTTRFIDLMGGEVTTPGGTRRFFRLKEPLDPNSPTLVADARAAGAWIDVADPWSWNLPVWLAESGVDSFALIPERLQSTGVSKSVEGHPRDKARLPDPHGVGLEAQEIYHHLLNCGLRIPPSAASGTGIVSNHLGYNRMYAKVERDDLSYEAWWDAVAAGCVTVTNGPLIQPFANGYEPGYVFTADAGSELEIDVAMNLTTRDKVEFVEIVCDGKVVESLSLEKWADNKGYFPTIRVGESGWFLVRAVTDLKGTYRFAASAPWYVEIGKSPRRVSRTSVQFFRDWLEQGIAKGVIEGDVESARKFWQDLLEQANAE